MAGPVYSALPLPLLAPTPVAPRLAAWRTLSAFAAAFTPFATRHDDLGPGAVAQLVHTIGDHLVARLDLARHRHPIAIHGTRRDRQHGHRTAAIEAIDEAALVAALDGRARHRHDLGQGVEQQTDIDELVGEKRVVAVGEFGPDLDGAGGRVDLVVGGKQATVRQSVLLLAVPGLDRDGLTHREPAVDGGEIRLRHGEQHRNRLQLGDAGQTVDIARVHLVARVDLT